MKNLIFKTASSLLFFILSITVTYAQVNNTVGVRYKKPSGQPGVILETTTGGGNSPHILFDARNGSASATKLFMLRQETNRLQFKSFSNSVPFQGAKNLMTLTSEGNVGVGIINPAAKLDVNGTLRAKYFSINGGGNLKSVILGQDPSGNAKLELRNGNSPYLDFTNNNAPNQDYDARFILRNDNQLNLQGSRLMIGNGNLSGGYLFGVHGKMIAEEVTVQLRNNWPDYVFADDYALTPLQDVEHFINENHHLPNIPSAKTMEAKDGVDLGELNRLLLEKIEELTLYTIDQEKRLNLLSAEIETLKSK